MRKRLALRLVTLILVCLLFSASIVIISAAACRNDDCDDDGWRWTPRWPVIKSLKRLQCAVSRLPKEAFKDPSNAKGQKETLRSMIGTVIELIKDKKYQQALNMLEEIENVIREWIRHCWQTYLIKKVKYIIWLIEWILCRDRKPPTIVTVLRYPETPNYDEPLIVIAHVIDKQSGVNFVNLSYSVFQIGWVNVTMESVDGLYVTEIQPQPYNTTVNYKVYAWDEAGNLAISETYFYVVADFYSPLISYVDRNPASPNYNQEVTVFANVTEPPEASGVKNVTLYYRTDGEWQPVEMTLDQLYTGIIPAFPYGTVVQYNVRSFDYAENWAASGVYSYTVEAPLNLPPVAIFTESAETVLTGVVINFNASSSDDPDGYIASYFWDFGDGNDATGVTADHAYTDDGVYIVALTVTDNDGATTTATSTKTILNRPPVASFTENATTVLTEEVISFDASGSDDPDGSIIIYVWDFGDEAEATGVTVTHAYADDGIYTVTLTVIDDDGATAMSSAAKTVSNRPPIAYFTENATIVEEDEVIHFDASGSNDPDGYVVSYFWDFGDGTNATDMIVDHAYAEEGNYTVVLTVTDDDGASSSVSATKTVEAVVTAGWPLSLLAAIGLGIAALTATLLYALYRRRKKKRGTASNPEASPSSLSMSQRSS